MEERRPGTVQVTSILVASDPTAVYGVELLHPCKDFPAREVSIDSEPMRGRGAAVGGGRPEGGRTSTKQDVPRPKSPAPPFGGERGGTTTTGAPLPSQVPPSRVPP